MIAPYNPLWPQLFETEKQALLQSLGDICIAIEHIGSTSVPGLSAKPLIDMIVGVKDLEDYKLCITRLQEPNYEFMPERMTSERAFFPKGPRENRTHHLSIVEYGSSAWTAPLAFRDYLRTHPDAAMAYQQLKQDLATRYPNDRAKYTEAKSSFIQQSHYI